MDSATTHRTENATAISLSSRRFTPVYYHGAIWPLLGNFRGDNGNAVAPPAAPERL